jgi:hypothetical protein
MVAHTCNPIYSGDSDQEIVAQGHPRQKDSQTHLNK